MEWHLAVYFILEWLLEFHQKDPEDDKEDHLKHEMWWPWK